MRHNLFSVVIMILAGLCIRPAVAVTIVDVNGAKTIHVGAGDMLAGQTDPNGDPGFTFNFRYSYGAYPDAYYLNGNFTTPDQSGWESALYAHIRGSRYDYSPGSGEYRLGRNPLGWPGDAGQPVQFHWYFDFTDTGKVIDKAVIRVARYHWLETDNPVTSICQVSADGINYPEFANITTDYPWFGEGNGINQDPNDPLDQSSYFDLTSILRGAKKIHILCTSWSNHYGVMGFFMGYSGNPNKTGFDTQIALASCAPLMPADLNGDCYVDMKDIAVLAESWLVCNKPNDPQCIVTW